MSIDQPTRCTHCGVPNGNHMGYCPSVNIVTEHSVFGPAFIEMDWIGDEDNVPEAEQTPATDPDSY